MYRIGWRRPPRRLETQLSLALTLLAMGVATVVAAMMLRVLHSAHEQSLRSSLQDAAHVTTDAVTRFVEAHRRAVAAAAIAIEHGTDQGTLLPALHQAYPGLLTMAVTDATGTVVAASPTLTPSGQPVTQQGFNIADRPYFVAARQSTDVHVSEVFRGRGLGDDVIVALAVALQDEQGAFQGVLQAALDLTQLGEILGDTADDPYSYVVIDNHDRAIFASSNQTIQPLDSVADRDWLATGRSVPGGDIFTLEEADTDWLGIFMPSAQGWTVGISTPKARLYQHGPGTLVATGLLLIAVSLMAWLLARWLARRVSRPVAHVARAMAKADLDDPSPSVQLPASGSSEVQDLVQSLQTLLTRLADSHTRLKEALTRESSARELLQIEMEDREQIIKARTLELHEANMALEQLSRQDGLTGLGNRRLLDERLELAWENCARDGEWLTVVLVDIDHFKAFNDTYGHQAGDQALKQVARALQRCTHRASDLAARYGGEEFCILLPRTAQDGAERFAEHIVEAVRQLAIIHGGGINGLVTISAGVATQRPESSGSATDLIGRADAALYQAKARGRDRWVCAKSLQLVAGRD